MAKKEKLPEQFFENKSEQARIRVAIASAIPVGAYYHNIIMALAELLVTFTRDAFRDEMRDTSRADRFTWAADEDEAVPFVLGNCESIKTLRPEEYAE